MKIIVFDDEFIVKHVYKDILEGFVGPDDNVKVADNIEGLFTSQADLYILDYHFEGEEQ